MCLCYPKYESQPGTHAQFTSTLLYSIIPIYNVQFLAEIMHDLVYISRLFSVENDICIRVILMLCLFCP